VLFRADDHGGPQASIDDLLEALEAHAPADAFCMMCVTMLDLFQVRTLFRCGGGAHA